MNRVMTKKEAAACLRVCVSTLDLYVMRGYLKPIHRGRRVMFTSEDVEKLSAKSLPSVWPVKQADANGNVRTVRELTAQ